MGLGHWTLQIVAGWVVGWQGWSLFTQATSTKLGHAFNNHLGRGKTWLHGLLADTLIWGQTTFQAEWHPFQHIGEILHCTCLLWLLTGQMTKRYRISYTTQAMINPPHFYIKLWQFFVSFHAGISHCLVTEHMLYKIQVVSPHRVLAVSIRQGLKQPIPTCFCLGFLIRCLTKLSWFINPPHSTVSIIQTNIHTETSYTYSFFFLLVHSK